MKSLRHLETDNLTPVFMRMHTTAISRGHPLGPLLLTFLTQERKASLQLYRFGQLAGIHGLKRTILSPPRSLLVFHTEKAVGWV